MYKVLVGGISPEGEHLLTSYLEKFMPDSTVEPLKAAGIKGKMKNHAKRQDVLLVILDDVLYSACVGVVDDVLALPKVHKYESDEGLKDFLVEKFGPLDDVSETGTIPPDMLMGQTAEEEEEEFIPKAADLSKDSSTGATIPPDSLSEPAVVDDELPTTEESEDVTATDAPSEVVEKLNGQIRDLRSELIGKETLIRNLTLQLNDKAESDDGDIAALVGRIRELEDSLAEKDAQLRNSEGDNFVSLGKVARAEQVLSEFDDLRAQLKASGESVSALEREKATLEEKLSGVEADAVGLREQVATIPGLKQEVEERTKRVATLEQEIEVKTALVSELETSVADHEGVVAELAQLKAELDVLQQQVDADKEKLARLDELEDELSAKALMIENLNTEIQALNDKLSARKSDIEQLRSDLQEKSDALDESHKALEGCREELRQKSQELAECVKARDEAVAQVNQSSEYSQTLVQSTQNLGQRITDLTDELNDKSIKVDQLIGELTEAKATISELNGSLERVTSERDDLSRRLGVAELSLKDKTSEAEDLVKQLAEARETSSSSMSEVQSKMDAQNAEISDLKGKLSARDMTVTKLQSDITDLHEQLAAKNGEITQTRDQMNTVRQQLLEAQSAGSEATISADTQRQALEQMLTEKTELEDKLVAAESKRMELEASIKSLEAELAQERTYRGSVDESNVELTAQNEKLANTVKQLEDNLVKAHADDELVSRLESDLLEERRRSARLQSEVDVMKRTRDPDKASDLRIEIVRLQSELSSLKNSSVPASELETAKAELVEARERAAKLELDLVEKESVVSAVQANVFSSLRNIAIPKGAYDFKYSGVANLSQKFVCVASGSEESTTNVYQVLRSACAAVNKRVVIVDLVTDSSIDKEFGIKKVTSPIAWLEGNSQFRPFIADTRFGHVKVLSTALAYINDLFLLTVDWQSRLAELDAFSAETVVLYVGCLNNLVTKVLFDMFSKAMTSYVVVKATPVNLRTTILNLTGFKELSPTVTVECVNFSDTSSAGMYQRLVAKYKAQILRDTEVLKL